MKKRSFLIILFASIFLCSISLFAGCVKTNKLQTPKLFDIDEDNVLAWSEVDYCRGYKVRIEAENGEVVERLTEKASYSLDSLDEGNYYVSVSAVGNNRDKQDSDWSTKYDFHKGYSTGLIYRLIENDTAYAITGVGKAVGDVTIEDVYRNKPVLMIGERAFKDSRRVESVTVGKNVSVISDSAFYGCVALKSVELPEDLLYIGESAFQSCTELKSITIPSGVNTIENYTFAYCRSLEKVEFLTKETALLSGESVIDGVTTIGEGAFNSCSSLSEVVLPQTLTGIGSSAFASLPCLENIDFPDSLQYINSLGFSGDTLLKEVVFGEQSQLTFLGKSAFRDCTSLATAQLPDGLTEIADYTFYGCTKLGNIQIPDSVGEMGRGVFQNTDIYNKQASDDANKFIFIDGWLVEYRDTIASFVFTSEWISRNGKMPANGIKGISSYCFLRAPVTRITLPSTVKYISSYAFALCDKLTVFETEERKEGGNKSELLKIGANSFQGCAMLAQIYLPSQLEEIGAYTFYDCEKLELLNTADNANQIPRSVARIGTRAFRNTAMWKSASPDNTGSDGILRLPIIKTEASEITEYWIVDYNNTKSEDSSLYSITAVDFSNISHVADYAFAQLETLSSVNASANLKSIGSGAFYKCTSLKSFELSRAFKKINPYTFYGCKSLVGVSVASEFDFALSSIGAYAFYDCEALSSFNLAGSEVTEIAPAAFAYCYRLRTFTFENEDYASEVTSIGSMAFYADFGLTAIDIPDSVEAIGARAFFQCESLRAVNFGNGVKYIYDSAFYGCDDIRMVELPSSLLYLGNSAFYKCPSLSEVTFKTEETEIDGRTEWLGIKYIGNYAFFNVERLDFVEIPQSVTYIGKYAFRGVFGASSVTIGDNLETLGAHAFYALDNMTVYTELTERPLGWSGKWNSLQRPVVWGVTLATDVNGAYVDSLTVTEKTFEYTDYRTISAPRRSGMYFRYWATENGEKTYSESEVVNAPIGTVLHAVWSEIEEWIIEKDSEGRIVYIVVGTGDMPEEVKISSKAAEDSSSGAGDVFDSDGEISYLSLCGWSYKRGGYAEFLSGCKFSDERVAALKPGTKLYAAYYTVDQLILAVREYEERTDRCYSASDFNNSGFSAYFG